MQGIESPAHHSFFRSLLGGNPPHHHPLPPPPLSPQPSLYDFCHSAVDRPHRHSDTMATPSSGGTTPGSAVQYCYMFEGDKRPTKQLDALLRAIAMHIVSHQTPHSPPVFLATCQRKPMQPCRLQHRIYTHRMLTTCVAGTQYWRSKRTATYPKEARRLLQGRWR